MRHDSVLSGPTRSAPGRGRAGVLGATLRRLCAFPARGYAGAALAAVLTGIVVNALTLQHERHPAPFFAARPPSVATPAPAAPPPAAATAQDSTNAPVLPPARPSNLTAGGEPATSGRGVDAIGDILRAESGKEAQKQILAAQNALIKLGYPVKADGSPSAATLAALRDFERVHSLPVSTEVTPRLVRQLTAAASASAR